MSAAARREQLIDVGRTVFANQGVAATTVEEIASAAGVTKPVVYEHFGGKEGLYAVIVDRDTTQMIRTVSESLTEGTTPRSYFELGITGMLQFIADNPDGFRLLGRDAPSWHSTGSLASLMSHIAEQIEGALASAMTASDLDAHYAPIYAQMIVGMCAMTGDWWLEHGDEYRLSEVAAHMVNLAWNGVKGLERDPALKTTTLDDEPPHPSTVTDEVTGNAVTPPTS